MKKTFLAIVAVALLAPACQKEYTCLCITENPLGGNDIEIPYDIEKTTKSKAEEACQQKENEANSSSTIPATNCELE
jgi:hypothetical protein